MPDTIRSEYPPLPQSVLELLDAVRAEDQMTTQKAVLLLDQCVIPAAELASWARFGHPEADSYGQATLHSGDSLELQVLSWQPGDMSAIHDIGDSSWGALKFLGLAEYARFEVREGLLCTLERRNCEAGSVLAQHRGQIQQIGNKGAAPMISLHINGTGRGQQAATTQRRVFDLDEGRIQVTTGGAFFLLPQEQVSSNAVAVQGDFPTWLRHNAELLRRMRVISLGGGRSGLAVREERLLREFNSVDTWQALRQELLIRLPKQDPDYQLSYITSLGQELASTTSLFAELVEAGRFEPRHEVLMLIGEIVSMLEDEDYIGRIAGA